MTVATEELVCTECGKGPFKNGTGLAAHTRIKHEEVEKFLKSVGGSASKDEEDVVEDLQVKLADALQRAEEAERERDEFKPTRSASGFILNTSDDVVERFGRQKLEDLARKELAVVNRRRAAQNLPPVDLSPEDMDAKLEEVIEELRTDRIRNGAASGPAPLPKSLKMIHPEGAFIQIPFEAQINNQAGSLEDAIARYRNKGYKLAVDDEGRTFCPAQNCWEPASVDSGKNVYGGYCSADHQSRTEANKGRPIDPNVYTRR